ncbi:MAG: metallophosphoesterase family protein [Deltaproteobacteria bacterium]|nr:metallophosphoesterase family protein [Deltaproteobacteria bacterium]
MMRIGVLSDTHNNLPDSIPALFDGVDLILHAGDIESPQLLMRLQKVAPVIAVRGNMDPPFTPDPLPRFRMVPLEGKRVLVTHRVGNPKHPPRLLKERLQQVRPDVVVFGHTHHPCNERIGGILFFNPGTAGNMRDGRSLSVGFLEIDDGDIHGGVVYLDRHERF